MFKKLLLMPDAPAGGATQTAAPAVEKPAAPAPPATAEAAPAAKPKTADPFSAVSAKDEKKTEPKTPDEKPADKKIAVQKNPVVEQRKRIEEQNSELATVRKELEQLRNQQKQSGGDVTAFAAKEKSLQDEIKELRGKIAERDYSQHPDYIKNYQKPFSDAATYAKGVVESLEVVDEGGVTRPANWEKDFAPIYGLPRAAVIKKARELFPDDSVSQSAFFAQFEKLHELDEKRQAALKEWHTGADEREKLSRAEQATKLENATKAFHAATNDMVEANSELFGDNPEDADENSLRQRSAQLVDAAYFNREKMNPEELLVLDAAIRLRAANFPVLQHRLNKAMAELAEFKNAKAGKAASRGGDNRQQAEAAPAATEESWNTDLRKSVGSAV